MVHWWELVHYGHQRGDESNFNFLSGQFHFKKFLSLIRSILTPGKAQGSGLQLAIAQALIWVMPSALRFTLHFSIALRKKLSVIIELSVKSCPIGPELHLSFDAWSSPPGCCRQSHEILLNKGMKC